MQRGRFVLHNSRKLRDLHSIVRLGKLNFFATSTFDAVKVRHNFMVSQQGNKLNFHPCAVSETCSTDEHSEALVTPHTPTNVQAPLCPIPFHSRLRLSLLPRNHTGHRHYYERRPVLKFTICHPIPAWRKAPEARLLSVDEAPTPVESFCTLANTMSRCPCQGNSTEE